MRIEACTFRSGEDLMWDEYVARHASAGLYHGYGWARVIRESYGQTPVYLWARRDDRVCGVLPLVRFRGGLGGRSLVSLPFLDEGGLCADDRATAVALWDAAREVASREKAHSIELRQRDPSGLPLESQGSKVTVMLELAGEPEGMWKRLDPKVRNQVRKAMNSGLTACWCGTEGLDDFYEVYAHNMRDLGSPVHGRHFFAAILDQFAGTARLLVVRDGSRTVAGAVCMVFRETVLVPWASSLRQWRQRCPSNLLYWEVIRSACEKGLRWLDFGRSSPGSGTYRFKMQWGGQERPLHWEGIAPGARRSIIEPDAARYRWIVRAWQKLPVSLTTVVGPVLRGRISN
jgi:serine/alanine adding enzyme